MECTVSDHNLDIHSKGYEALEMSDLISDF